jgi:hypothetical protein
MTGEINKDFYCSAGCYDNLFCKNSGFTCKGNICNLYHCKHPTPEQFKEEYGFEWEGAVYFNGWYEDGTAFYSNGEYRADCLNGARILINHERLLKLEKFAIVCACTSWGKPDKDWRPI